MAALQAQDVVQLFGGLQGFFEGEKLFFVFYLANLAAKFFGVLGIEIKQGVFNVSNLLFDFFGSFE